MLAPKALNLDKGHNIAERAPRDGSSSEFSEDDTPLAVRLNLQGNSGPNVAGKQRTRSSLTKKGGFVIPRKKKQANGKLMIFSLNYVIGDVTFLNTLKFLAHLLCKFNGSLSFLGMPKKIP